MMYRADGWSLVFYTEEVFQSCGEGHGEACLLLALPGESIYRVGSFSWQPEFNTLVDVGDPTPERAEAWSALISDGEWDTEMLLRLSCELGSSDGCNYYAYRYLSDAESIIQYTSAACLDGDALSCAHLGRALWERGEPMDLLDAPEVMRRSCLLGSRWACDWLGSVPESPELLAEEDGGDAAVGHDAGLVVGTDCEVVEAVAGDVVAEACE